MRFIIKGGILEIAQMLSLYLWHSRFLLWLKACVMTAGFERVAHFLLLSPPNHTLTRGDTLNGEEMTWFLHERCHNTHLNGDRSTSGPRRWSVLLPSLMVSPHVPLDVFLVGVLPHFFVSWTAPQVCLTFLITLQISTQNSCRPVSAQEFTH